MPTQRQDGIGLLVIRAYVADARSPTILVRVLEVGRGNRDREIGTATTANEAGRIVVRWLRALQSTDPDVLTDPTEEPA